MREPSKPSTAKCTCSLYILFLLAEPKYVSCVRLSEVIEGLSHDSVNRFLLRENYTPRDLFDEVKEHLILVGGIASGDDSVLDKPYSDLYYTDITGTSYPVNFRIYDKREGKTKNEYFREMVAQVRSLGAETGLGNRR